MQDSYETKLGRGSRRIELDITKTEMASAVHKKKNAAIA
jgi:hypothetical protein